jgi:hypothetical protein
LGKVRWKPVSKQATCGSLRLFAQQDLDGFQRERLVQRRQWNETLEIGKHRRIDAGWLEVLAATVDDAVGDGDDLPAVQAGEDAFTDQRQRRAIGMRAIELNCEWHNAGFAEVGLRPTDALHLAIPHGFARQGIGRCIEHRELDAR